MKQTQRQIEVLISSLAEMARIEQVISSLPRGYISVKQIAGHVYYYRQYREGNKIISHYVPDAFLNGVKQKIIIRKENEQLLKITKKDIVKAMKAVSKAGLLTEEQILLLKDSAEFDKLPLEERKAFAESKFPNANSDIKKQISYYVEGLASYNNILLTSWGF